MKTLQQILEAKLNSLTSDKFENLSDTLFNSENRYEPAYFRKFLESEEIAVKDIKKELEKYYIHYEMSDKTLKLIKDKAKKNNIKNVVCFFGTGYDGNWGSVIFFNDYPFEYIIIKNGEESLCYTVDDEDEVIYDILNFNK